MQATNDNGLIDGLSNEDYHENHALGASGLKMFLRSPAHYWAAYRDPERARPDKLAWRIGRAWHCAVFEPDEFDGRYAVQQPMEAAAEMPVRRWCF